MSKPRAAKKATRQAARPERLQPFPRVLENAMQALAYWLGYQASRYPQFRLPSEGAMVDELAALLCGAVGTFSRSTVRRERSVACLTGGDSATDRRRVDLVVSQDDGTDVDPSGNFILELKRSSASLDAIDADLERVAEACGRGRNRRRGFVLVVGDAVTKFVDGERLVAQQDNLETASRSVRYRVRRVVRAHGAVEATTDAGHWVTALEIV